ncbi:histidinol-phosphate aminotransferase family protein, partial [Streptomyces sp. NPDC003514]
WRDAPATPTCSAPRSGASSSTRPRTPPPAPARGGLTAAQVRGTTGPVPGLAPAPATGWPQAQSWPNAAGMGQTG